MSSSDTKRKFVLSMIVFVSIWNSLFLMLRRQCFNRHKSVRSRQTQAVVKLIDSFKQYRKRFLCWIFVWHTISLLNYSIQILISLDIFEGARVFDCFLIHRAVLPGRSYGLVKYFCLIDAAMLLYCHVKLNFFAPKQRFDCFEFLLYDAYDVLTQQIGKKKQDPELPNYENKFWLESLAREDDECRNSLFYLKNPISSTRRDQYIARPNRSPRSWQLLNQYLVLPSIIYIYMVAACVLPIVFLLSPGVITKLGFELSYPICAHFIRDRQAKQLFASFSNLTHDEVKLDYSYIYTPSGGQLADEKPVSQIPIFLAYENFLDINLYSVLKILADYNDTISRYVDAYLSCLSMAYTNYVMSADLFINWRAIRSRLGEILAQLDEHRQLSGFTSRMASVLPETGQTRPIVAHGYNINNNNNNNNGIGKFCNKRSHELDDAINQIQAILHDHFKLLNGYNRYVTFMSKFYTIIWLAFSITMCTWLCLEGKAKEMGVDFLVTEGLMFIGVITVLASPCVLRKIHFNLYSQIASAMALDDDWRVSKPRWMAIIRYYYPRPLSSFTILEKVEMSWLLCLQLVGWIFSAMLVWWNYAVILGSAESTEVPKSGSDHTPLGHLY